MRHTKLTALGMCLVAGCAFAQPAPNPGLNLDLMDTSVKPGDDFFRYVNGKWLDETEIPADRTRWSSFDELRQNTDADVMSLLKEAASNPKFGIGTDQGKAIAYYNTIMDTVARDKAGIAPLKPYLNKIDKIKTLADLQAYLIEMEPYGGMAFFRMGVGPDATNSNRNVVGLYPSRLPLPDRDYYLSEDADMADKRKKYTEHVARMLAFLGDKPASAKSAADRILAMETRLVTDQLDRVALRDRRNTNNPMALAELQQLTPSVNWNKYFETLGVGKLDTVVVSQPKYMTSLETFLKQTPISDIKMMLRWNLINKYSDQLSTNIEAANFDFFGTALTGVKQPRPRDQRALQSVNGSLGEALGKLYVEKHFPPEAKAKAQEMIDYIFLAFENRINNLPWMNPQTKEKALAKLNKFDVKIGYPDKWRDYSALVINSKDKGGSYFSNVQQLSKWRFDESLKDLRKPVDKSRWGMSPQTVNAYYRPSSNEIVFPAAILQPPFYDYKADVAVNFGGIGAVIGHEISHGFDDSGSRYDADGNLVNWWLDEDLKQFTKLGEALSAQYSALEPLPGVFVDGKYTLGENIGDLGGVNAAYDGLQLYLRDKGRPGLIDGYTPEQRFFLSWASIWRTKMRDEAILHYVKTDSHSPGMYRAYMPLLNVDAFYEAFGISPKDKQYIAPEQRVKIW